MKKAILFVLACVAMLPVMAQSQLSVLGVPFGSDKAVVIKALQEDGSAISNELSKEGTVVVANKKIGGITWDEVVLTFQNRGGRSFLSRCELIKNNKNRSEAFNVAENVRFALTKRYGEMEDDPNGEGWYNCYGGEDPTDVGRYAVRVLNKTVDGQQTTHVIYGPFIYTRVGL